MLYDLSHRTSYSYASPVDLAWHALHLRARTLPFQTVHRSEIVSAPVASETREAIDHFGNAVTNIAYRDLTRPARIELLRVEAKPSLFLPFIKTYGDMAKGSLAALWSSHGLLEIAMNGGNAAQELDLHRGCPVRIIPDPLLSTTL